MKRTYKGYTFTIHTVFETKYNSDTLKYSIVKNGVIVKEGTTKNFPRISKLEEWIVDYIDTKKRGEK